MLLYVVSSTVGAGCKIASAPQGNCAPPKGDTVEYRGALVCQDCRADHAGPLALSSLAAKSCQNVRSGNFSPAWPARHANLADVDGQPRLPVKTSELTQPNPSIKRLSVLVERCSVFGFWAFSFCERSACQVNMFWCKCSVWDGCLFCCMLLCGCRAVLFVCFVGLSASSGVLFGCYVRICRQQLREWIRFVQMFCSLAQRSCLAWLSVQARDLHAGMYSEHWCTDGLARFVMWLIHSLFP